MKETLWLHVCFSPAVGSWLAMAMLPVLLASPGTRLEVMLAGRGREAVVLPGPPVLTQPARQRLERQRERRGADRATSAA